MSSTENWDLMVISDLDTSLVIGQQFIFIVL